MSGIGRGSTQDLVTGTPVAIIVNEAGDGSLIQAVTWSVRKSDASWTHRGPLTLADAVQDLSAAGFGSSGLIDLGNSPWLEIAATCNVPGRTVQYRVVWYDEASVPRGLSELRTMTSDPALRVSAAGDYIAYADTATAAAFGQMSDAGTARYAKVFITLLAGGSSWDFYARPA
jgi:hypothetical protein